MGNTSNFVAKRLDTFYSCSISDCYEHPEYLRTALTYAYRDDYRYVLAEIKLELGDLINDPYISDFLKTLEIGLESKPLFTCPKCKYNFVPESASGIQSYVMGYDGCPKCGTKGIRNLW